MARFSSSKNTITVLILWGLVFFLSTVLYLNIKLDDLEYLPIILVLLVIGVIIWILFDTRYVIKDSNLLYRSGPFRGRIDILSIKKIKQHSGFNIPVTFKPALNYNGYIITYNNFDDVFVSPKNHTIFIEELLKINGKIEVV
jgi:hypothetical protein